MLVSVKTQVSYVHISPLVLILWFDFAFSIHSDKKPAGVEQAQHPMLEMIGDLSQSLPATAATLEHKKTEPGVAVDQKDVKGKAKTGARRKKDVNYGAMGGLEGGKLIQSSNEKQIVFMNNQRFLLGDVD